MGRSNDEHLARLNTLGIPWEEMTEEQKLQQRLEWDKIVSDPKNLECTCGITGCRNNHNCNQCVTLHRYFDGYPNCLRPLEDVLEKGVPQERRYNMHYKIQSAGGNDKTGLVDAHDPDGSRKRLVQNAGRQNMIEVMNTWQKIAQDPKNRACRCKNADCWYHGNCVKCVALHRYYGGFPACDRYIVDMIDEIVDAYWAEQGGRPEA